MNESQVDTAPQFSGFALVDTSQNDGGRVYKHTTNQEDLLLPSSIVLPAGVFANEIRRHDGGKYQDQSYRKAAISCVRKRFDRGLEHQSHVFEQSTYGEFCIVVLDMPAILPDRDYIMQLAIEKRRLCIIGETRTAFGLCPINWSACGGRWWESLKSDIQSIFYDIIEKDERFYLSSESVGSYGRHFCFNPKRPEMMAKRKANRVTKPKIRRVHCWRHVDAFCSVLAQTFWYDYRVNITLNGTKIEKMRSFGSALAFLRRAKRNLDHSYLDKLRCYGYYRDGDRSKLDANCAFEEVAQATPKDETERLFQRHVKTLRSMFYGNKATGKRRQRKQSPRKVEHR